MRFGSKPATLPEIVEDIVKDMSEADKASVVNTATEHARWTQGSVCNGTGVS